MIDYELALRIKIFKNIDLYRRDKETFNALVQADNTITDIDLEFLISANYFLKQALSLISEYNRRFKNPEIKYRELSLISDAENIDAILNTEKEVLNKKLNKKQLLEYSV